MSQARYVTKEDIKHIKDALIDIFITDADFRKRVFEMLEDFLLANAIDEGMKTKDIGYEYFEREIK